MILLLAFVASFAAGQDLNLNPTAQEISKAKPATNTICPITKADIGTMGAGISIIYKGQVILLCCEGCKAEFAKDPEKALKGLATASEKATCDKSGSCAKGKGDCSKGACAKDGKCTCPKCECAKDGKCECSKGDYSKGHCAKDAKSDCAKGTRTKPCCKK